jgi:hypothetical protein
MDDIIVDAGTPGPPGLMNKEPTLEVVFEGIAGSLTSPRSKCSP